MAIDSLKRVGCRTVYIDGSFVTSKGVPNDFDVCWEEAGVAPELLDPVLLQFDAGRAAQKARYLGELFPASLGATVEGMSFLEFFQTDRETGGSKGIVAVDLGGADDQVGSESMLWNGGGGNIPIAYNCLWSRWSSLLAVE